MLSRAGLPDRLVQLSLTLCLIHVFPYALNETEIICYEEDEPLNVPGPPFNLCSWNMSGAAHAFLPQSVRNFFASNLAFSEKTDALAKEQANEDFKDLNFPQWEPLTLPIYAYIPLTEWEPLTLPFYASVLNYVPYSIYEPVSVLDFPSPLYNVPYNAIKPTCVLGFFNLDMYALDDPYVPVPCRVLETFNAPRSLCLRDPYLKSLSFRGNGAKFQTPQRAFHRQEDAKVLCSLKKTLKSR